MNKEDYLKLLNEMPNGEDQIKNVAAHAETAIGTDTFQFLLAVKEHLTNQELRASKTETIDLGRLQGMHNLTDFFTQIIQYRDALGKRNETGQENEVPVEKVPQAPTGYGSI